MSELKKNRSPQEAFQAYSKALKFDTASHAINAVIINAEAGCYSVARLMLAKVAAFVDVEINLIELLHNKIRNEYFKNKNKEEIQPLISVIVPYHNRAKTIKKCLMSILNQSIKNIEVIAVDDGSTDSSYELVSSITDKRLINIRCPVASGNSGSPRNIGIKISRGNYIAFVDSDDFVENEFHQQLYTCALNNPDSDIIFSNSFKKISESNNIENINRIKYLFIPEIVSGENKNFYFSNSFVIWDKLYKREFLWRNKIFLSESKIGADTLMIAKAYYFSDKVSVCNNTDCYCYAAFSEDSVSKKYRTTGDVSEEDSSYLNIFEWMKNNDIDQGYLILQWMRRLMSISYCLKSCNFNISRESFLYLKIAMRDAPIKSIISIFEKNKLSEHKKNLIEFEKYIKE